MDYFATFNKMRGAVNESLIKAVHHYDIWAILLAVIVFACFIALIANRINLMGWLNKKDYKDDEHKKEQDKNG